MNLNPQNWLYKFDIAKLDSNLNYRLMKKNFKLSGLITCLFSLLFAVISCKPAEVKQELSSISIAEDIQVEASGGEYTVPYEIQNPVEGIVLTAQTEVSWLKVDVNEEAVVLNVEPNGVDSIRTAVVELYYNEECSSSFEVVQNGVDPLFRIVVEEEEITTSRIVVSVFARDPEMGYFLMTLPKENYDKVESDEELYNSLIEYVQALADQKGQTLEVYMAENEILQYGNVQSKDFNELNPATEYCVFAVGSDEKGQKLSDVFTINVSTKAVEMVDMTFDFEFLVDGTDVTMNVEPSSQEYYYYFDVTDQEVLDYYGMTVDEIVAGVIKNNVDYAKQNGITVEAMMKSTCSIGPGSKQFDLDPDMEWIGLAVAVSLDGNIISAVDTTTFHTGSVKPSDNEISLKIYNVSVDRAFLDVTTSNNDPYAFSLVEKKQVEGMSEEQIVEYLTGGQANIFQVYEGGPWTQELPGLMESTTYVMYAFGYEFGVVTTGLFASEFTTLASGDAYSFEMHTEIKDLDSYGANITFSGEPEEVLYCFGVVEEGKTEAEIKEKLEADMKMYVDYGIYKDRLAYFKASGKRGSVSYDYNLEPETNYITWSVSIEEETGNFAVFKFGEKFSTPERIISDVKLDIVFDKYFDADELADAYPGQYDYYRAQGFYCLPVRIETSEPVEYIRQGIFQGDMTDETTYNDAQLMASLISRGYPDTNINWFAYYNMDMTLLVIAKDKDGNYTKVFRKLVNLSKDGVSDVSEFPAPVSQPSKVLELSAEQQ